MATLVLTAVGSAIAGPIGAAIGAMAGQRVDQMLFAPKARSGARLASLAVQTSTYGTSLPKVFGRMRVSGAVIRATDLREERKTVSQGKGRPKATVYSYSASFAVALSARAAVRVGRIWADGKLLRGEAGDFKVETGFRFYAGDEDQMPDPLIASAEGAGETPAYRGLAYAVFEDMALESFGNRIPMLSFELIAEEDPVSVGAIIGELGGAQIDADCPAQVLGYVADGASVRAAIAPLVELVSADSWYDGHRLRIAEQPDALAELPADSLGARIGESVAPRIRRTRAARGRAASAVELGYADVARDFQSGLQRADRFTGPRAIGLDLPAAMGAAMAHGFARRLLASREAGDETLEISVPWRHLPLLNGGAVRVAGTPRVWRIQSINWVAMHLSVTLVPLVETTSLLLPADAGRSLAPPDLIHGPTRLVLLDLPLLEAGTALAPVVVAAAAGPSSPGWKGAGLLRSLDGGLSWQDAGSTAAPATIGTAPEALGMASAAVFDMHNSLVVDLLHEAMSLHPADDAALLAGGNLAMLEGEVLQFGAAERLGPARYRLTRLLRGRRGTEHAIFGHVPGETFVLLERESLMPVEIPYGVPSLAVMATGIGDASGVRQDLASPGIALRPLAPVHLSALRRADGALALNWIRRSRDGWQWIDAVESPLGEERERYRITVAPDVGVGEVLEIGEPQSLVPAAQISGWQAVGANRISVTVQQIGTFGASLPAQIVIQL